VAARLEEVTDGVVGKVGGVSHRSGGSANGRPSTRLVGAAIPHAQKLASAALLGYQTNNESTFWKRMARRTLRQVFVILVSMNWVVPEYSSCDGLVWWERIQGDEQQEEAGCSYGGVPVPHC
jgi:hypothetical protein